MNKVWILVCDSARGRLFDVQGANSNWLLVETFTHGESRERTSELVTDHAGQRSSEGGSVTHGALAPASTPKEVEKHHFAHALVKVLDQGMRARRFEHLVLVAPPQFLGKLKAELTPELKKHLMTTVDKDLTNLPPADVADRLKDAVRIPLDQQVS